MKLDSNLNTRLANNTLGKAKPKYSWQYFTISIFLVVKSFTKNLLITKSSDCRSDLVKQQFKKQIRGQHYNALESAEKGNWTTALQKTLSNHGDVKMSYSQQCYA